MDKLGVSCFSFKILQKYDLRIKITIKAFPKRSDPNYILGLQVGKCILSLGRCGRAADESNTSQVESWTFEPAKVCLRNEVLQQLQNGEQFNLYRAREAGPVRAPAGALSANDSGVLALRLTDPS